MAPAQSKMDFRSNEADRTASSESGWPSKATWFLRGHIPVR
jgi:hypothetical protein